MRRYWHPVAAAAQMKDKFTMQVRILGEDLILYKDRGGVYGLIDPFCLHRRMNMIYGIPEDRGLRCPYHGWCYDETGQCIEQPYEEAEGDSRFKDKIKIKAYPVREQAGLLMAYLGPDPAPLLPAWDVYAMSNVVRDIGYAMLPCNWLQCQENSLDPVHLEWLHSAFTNYVLERLERPERVNQKKHAKIGFDVFEYGIVKRRMVEGDTGDEEDWKVGHPVLFPNILLTGSQYSYTMQFRTPIDDTHTYHVSQYIFPAAPGQQAPIQEFVPYRMVPLQQEDGNWVLNYTFNQDYMAWITQGDIAKRDQEKLGESDRGIIMMRRKMLEQIEVVGAGGEPKAVVRDAEANRSISLPIIGRDRYLKGAPRGQLLREASSTPGPILPEGFVFLAGQPEEIRAAYRRAMGLDE